MKELIIPNQSKLEELKVRIQREGIGKLHILSDFDKTLTKAFVNGKSFPSLISVLRHENYLTEDYSKKAHELYEKYHPVEINPSIPISEKKKAMHEWWSKHFDLLIKSRLNKRDLQKVVNSGNIEFREGVGEFLDILRENNIPLVIISSSGLGEDSVSMYLKSKNKLYKNIHIISNFYIWDKEGYAVGIKKPIIHAMNKDETMLKDFPFYDLIKERRNVILLGDNLEDTGMITGFDYDSLIKLGFLNENIKENLEHYKKAYDIVITDDGDFNYVNDLLKEIIS